MIFRKNRTTPFFCKIEIFAEFIYLSGPPLYKKVRRCQNVIQVEEPAPCQTLQLHFVEIRALQNRTTSCLPCTLADENFGNMHPYIDSINMFIYILDLNCQFRSRALLIPIFIQIVLV